MNDCFEAQRLIIDRLGASVPGLRAVHGARDLEEIKAHRGTAPAAYVLYDGQEPFLGAGSVAAVDQKWLVVAAVHNLRESMGGLGEGNEAGDLLIRFSRVLLGWRPGPDHGPMTLDRAPAPQFAGGFGFYPMGFRTRVVLRGDGE